MTGIVRRSAIVWSALLLGACSHNAGKGLSPAPRPAAGVLSTPAAGTCEIERPEIERPAGADLKIADLSRIPQEFGRLAAAARERLPLADACRDRLHGEFQSRFFAPWSGAKPAYDPAESGDFMRHEGEATWYGPNKQKLAPKLMQELVANCALESFPSRNDTAISVAPGHLRGLPTHLPLYKRAEDFPFDMLSYPQVKLNEPLRVLHASRDGAWLFVETGYSDGWIERRDVALVDRDFIGSWRQAPHVVVVQDYAPVPDGRGVAVSRSKVGTILALAREGAGGWEVAVASAGEGGRAQSRAVQLPLEVAAPFPLAFNPENVARIGNQLLGEPYGWGESFDLRDCSALLRDFFLPFGIWLPRTSADQLASLPGRVKLARLTPPEKEDLIRSQGVPFLTLLYKPGHIMLYLGGDGEGRPLVFHDAWSIRLKELGSAVGADDSAQASGSGSIAGATAAQTGTGSAPPGAKSSAGAQRARTQIIGVSAITTLEPGKELGLVPGGSLLERDTELATITSRCQEPSRPDPVRQK